MCVLLRISTRVLFLRGRKSVIYYLLLQVCHESVERNPILAWDNHYGLTILLLTSKYLQVIVILIYY